MNKPMANGIELHHSVLYKSQSGFHTKCLVNFIHSFEQVHHLFLPFFKGEIPFHFISGIFSMMKIYELIQYLSPLSVREKIEIQQSYVRL